MQTVDLTNIPIFSTGKWEGKGSKAGGDDITPEYLNSLVETFSKIGDKVKPRMILSHDKGESQKKTGMPAIGWITNLATDGRTLFADIKNIPKKVYDLIQAKAFGRFSPGIWTKMNIDGQDYQNVLEHLALLGAELPADMGIDGMIDLYELDNTGNDLIIYEREIIMADENRIKDLESHVEKLGSDIKTFEKDKKDMKNTHDLLVLENARLKDKLSKIEFAKAEGELKTYLEGQVAEGKIVPAQIEALMAIGLADSNVKEYGKTKGSGMELVKSIVENAAKVDFSKQTKQGKVSTEPAITQWQAYEASMPG